MVISKASFVIHLTPTSQHSKKYAIRSVLCLPSRNYFPLLPLAYEIIQARCEFNSNWYGGGPNRNNLQKQEVQIKIARAIDDQMTLHRNVKGTIHNISGYGRN